MQTMAAISGAKLIQRAVRGDASSRNEKSGNLASCLLVRGVLFRPLAIRYDVFPGHRGATRRAVRKHGAPKGALRQKITQIRHIHAWCSQKARSTKRCIKTYKVYSGIRFSLVRKHRAPKGALRPSESRICI